MQHACHRLACVGSTLERNGLALENGGEPLRRQLRVDLEELFLLQWFYLSVLHEDIALLPLASFLNDGGEVWVHGLHWAVSVSVGSASFSHGNSDYTNNIIPLTHHRQDLRYIFAFLQADLVQGMPYLHSVECDEWRPVGMTEGESCPS